MTLVFSCGCGVAASNACVLNEHKNAECGYQQLLDLGEVVCEQGGKHTLAVVLLAFLGLGKQRPHGLELLPSCLRRCRTSTTMPKVPTAMPAAAEIAAIFMVRVFMRAPRLVGVVRFG